MDPVPDPLLLRKSGSAGDRTRDLCICSQKLRPLDHRGCRRYLYVPIHHNLYTLKNFTNSNIKQDVMGKGRQERGYKCFRMRTDSARRTRRLRTLSEVTKITSQLLQQSNKTVRSTTRSTKIKQLSQGHKRTAATVAPSFQFS